MTSTTRLTLGEHVLNMPVEMQNEIFVHCLQRPHHAYTEAAGNEPAPNLLVTFRADENLYMQAFKIYYAINGFNLDSTRIQAFNRLRPTMIALIHNPDTLVESDDPHFSTPKDPYTGSSSKFPSASKLRSLRFHVFARIFDGSYPEPTLRSFLKLFPRLIDFRLVIFKWDFGIDRDEYKVILPKLSRYLDGILDPKLRTEHKKAMPSNPQCWKIEWKWAARAGGSVYRVGAHAGGGGSDSSTLDTQ